MQAVKTYVGKAAPTDSNVLITGETGTGKELIAALLHANSPRHSKPFVCINCAAIPDSLFESELFGHERGAFTGAHTSRDGVLQHADGGTIFLDEVGDMSPYAQAKVLRAIETKEVQRVGGTKSLPVNVRVLAATNRDLEQSMGDNGFRKDLFFRLNVARVHLPPLRERKEDLALLCAHYFAEFNRRFGRNVTTMTDEAWDAFLHYAWPGNVRELKNVLKATFINLGADRIGLSDLPEMLTKHHPSSAHRQHDERESLLAALCATNWNKSHAAKKLHWSRMTLYRKMSKYHITEAKPQWASNA